MVAGGQWPVAVSLLEALKTEQLEADVIAARHVNTVNRGFGWTIWRKQAITHRIHGAAIYGSMDPINIPPMLAYIPAPWILWVIAWPAKCRILRAGKVEQSEQILCFSVLSHGNY